MKKLDLVIKNAKLVLESGIVRGGVGVSNGRIALIASDEHLPEADETIDAEKKYLLPGLIDGHAHIHDPEMEEHEDFTTGSRAAAAGGVTTVVDMPLVSQVDTVEAVERKVELGENMSIVDFSFYGGMLTSENVGMIPKLLSAGVAAFKAFTAEPFYARGGAILRALSETSEHGGHLAIHSEDRDILDEFSGRMDGEWDAPISHALSRPEIAEEIAVERNIAILKKTGGHLHIAHITTRGALVSVERAKLNGNLVTTEVCPHHLQFHRDEMNRLGTKSKMNPPLRSKQDRAALWSALLRGTIDIVVSDHAPAPIEKKEEGEHDIRNAWAGVDGVQMISRVLLSEGINKNRLTFHHLVEVTSSKPAKLFGLYPKKGVLAVGSDADMVLIDLTKKEKISADMIFSKCGWTLYEGMEMTGAPIMTFVRGVKVFEEDRTTIKPGHGQFQKMGDAIQL